MSPLIEWIIQTFSGVIVGDDMPAISIGKFLPPRFNPNRWCRNAVPVPYQVEGRTRSALNHVLKWHGKMLFRSPGKLAAPASGGAGERKRWRGAGRTSPMTEFVAVIMRMTANGTEVEGQYFSRFTLTPVGGAALTPVDMHYNGGIAVPGDAPAHHTATLYLVPVSPSTDYTWLFADHDGGRLVSGEVHEIMLPGSTLNGYINPIVGVLQPIYDSDRDTAYTLANTAWKDQAGTCINFTTDTDSEARTRTSATAVNLIDNSSTTVGANIPHVKIDNRWRNRRSKTTVPYVFKAFGSMPAGTGTVILKDSAGTTKATININSAVEGWFSTTVNLDATEDRYYVMYAGSGANPVTVKTAQLYEKE